MTDPRPTASIHSTVDHTGRIFRLLATGVLALAVMLAGGGRWILLLCVAHALVESFAAMRTSDRAPDPVVLFTVGWVLPFVLTYIPVQEMVFRVRPLDRRADLAWLLTYLAFLVCSLGAAVVIGRRPRGRPTGAELPNPPVPWQLVLATLVLSTTGFLAAFAANGFRAPAFQANVTEAAAEFFRIRGTASLFDLGKVGAVFGVWWVVVSGKDDRRRGQALLLGTAVAIFLVEELLYGKRMGLLLTLLGISIVLAALRVMRARHALVMTTVLALFVTGNAYVRAKPYFDTGWRNEDVSTLSDLWQLALLQPVIYVTETFANLGALSERDLSPARTPYTNYVAGKLSKEELAQPSDLFTDLRSRGRMVPFVGWALASGGIAMAAVWTLLFAAIVWAAYGWSDRGVGLVIYAIIGARYFVVWTGNYLANFGTYYNVAFTLLLFGLATLAAGRTRKPRREPEDGDRAAE